MPLKESVVNRLTALLDSALAYFLLPLIAAGIIGYGAWASVGLGIPFAIMVGFVTLGGISVFWHQAVRFLDRRRRKRMAMLSPSEMEAQIRGWLYKHGYPITNVNGQIPPKELDFAISTQATDRVRVIIMKQQGDPAVVITSDIGLDEKTRRILADRAPLFEHKIAPQLFILGAQSNWNYCEQGLLTRINVHQFVIFDEGLSDYSFLQEMLWFGVE